MPGASYELAFTLYLLDHRIGTRRSIVVYDAITAAISKRTPRHFFDATYRSQEEADAKYLLYSIRQEHAEAIAKAEQPWKFE